LEWRVGVPLRSGAFKPPSPSRILVTADLKRKKK
jgi:hypothetical protein